MLEPALVLALAGEEERLDVGRRVRTVRPIDRVAVPPVRAISELTDVLGLGFLQLLDPCVRRGMDLERWRAGRDEPDTTAKEDASAVGEEPSVAVLTELLAGSASLPRSAHTDLRGLPGDQPAPKADEQPNHSPVDPPDRREEDAQADERCGGILA